MTSRLTESSNPLQDIRRVADEMLNNTGLIPLCVDVGDTTYCATFNGISYKYTKKFENGTWHVVNPPLSYQQLKALYSDLKPHRPVTFVGGGS